MTQLSKTITNPIIVIGISAGGKADVSARQQAIITAADLLVGGKRHLGYFPDFAGETIAITGKLDPVIARLRQTIESGKKAVVLASGDPLFYGIGRTLRRHFLPRQLRIEAAPSAPQLAFAALSEPWHDALLLSAHAHPLEKIIPQVMAAQKAAILTDRTNTPSVIAARLVDIGAAPETPCAVCENLGGEAERIVRTTLRAAAKTDFAPLNVFVIWPQNRLATPISPGLPDDAFSTWNKQLTKREIRLLSLAELQLQPGEVMWDIGAGSGSVCIEAARLQPDAVVYAVEKRPELCAHIQENLTRFPAPNLQLTEGAAPDAVAGWPNPNAVFVGGSGGRLPEIIGVARQRLRPGGRLVVNLVVLENLFTLRQLLPEAAVTQVQINRGVPIVEMLRFEPVNPVFVVVWRKPVE